MIKATFLVDNSLIGDAYVDLGKRGFLKNIQSFEVRPEASGQDGATLVQVVISEAAALAIRDADVKARLYGRTPKVQVTEYADEPVDDRFLDASPAPGATSGE